MPLFEEGSANDDYEVPFKESSELTNILNDLEEQNLKLILQDQEMEQTLELKKKK